LPHRQFAPIPIYSDAWCDGESTLLHRQVEPAHDPPLVKAGLMSSSQSKQMLLLVKQIAGPQPLPFTE
jgi:hypothetical protein